MSGTSENRLLSELNDKEFRDAYVVEHVKTGLAYQIRALRQSRGWSQDEFAQRSRKTQSGVARLEDPEYGKFSLTTLLSLASAFDVALLVRFVRFSELLQRTRDLSPTELNVASFDDDPWLRWIEGVTLVAGDSSQYIDLTQEPRLGLSISSGDLPPYTAQAESVVPDSTPGFVITHRKEMTHHSAETQTIE